MQARREEHDHRRHGELRRQRGRLLLGFSSSACRGFSCAITRRLWPSAGCRSLPTASAPGRPISRLEAGALGEVLVMTLRSSGRTIRPWSARIPPTARPIATRFRWRPCRRRLSRHQPDACRSAQQVERVGKERSWIESCRLADGVLQGTASAPAVRDRRRATASDRRDRQRLVHDA